MKTFHGWLILLTCAQLCTRLFYAQGFDIEGSKTECFCADRVAKNTPVALPITLRWIHPKKAEEPGVEETRPSDY